ncbi:MAG: AMP-dependent synthetase, partial [Actinomycetospora chiangmaiensis]|nr:AMP-dependent synthetase [Actinomycetospora chiangmaiensis]
AGLMGRLSAYPPVWWNGPGADFASLDLALAELA